MDLARGFAALIVVICHVGLYIGGSIPAMYTFADIIGSEPAAPVFMALMGAGIAYSRHNDPKSMLLRGITLFIEGYLLSAFRTLLPLLIFGEIDEWASVASFFVVDILQFAGITFMLMALLKKIKMPSWGILILSVGFVLIGQIFIANPPAVKSEWLIYFVNLFIPITEWSCFPFLTWFFFPAFGLVFGEALRHCGNKKLFYGILLPISLAGIIYVYIQFYRFYPAYAENYYFGGNYYYMGIKNVLLTALFVTFFISFWYFANKILPNFIRSFLTFLSRNLTVFYALSWIFISIIIHLSAKFSLSYSMFAIIAMMVIMVALCYAVTYIYQKIRTRKFKQKNT